MKTIKILGTGCPNCNQMEKIVQAVITQLNLDIKIEKVEDIQEIMKYNIMSTPAIVIDEKVVLKGRVPSLAEAKELLENAIVSSCCSDSYSGSCCEDAHPHEDACCSSEAKAKGEACCSSTDSNCC